MNEKQIISNHMASMGRKGGRVMSERKRKAIVANLKKANAARLKRSV